MHTFFLAPTHNGVGLTSITLGLVRALDNLGMRVKFFKPISQQVGSERSTRLIQRIMGLETPIPMALQHVENLLGDNKGDVLMEEIVAQYATACADCDVMVVEGLVPTRYMPYANRLNADIAKTINADIVLVSEQGEDSLADLADKLEIAADNFGGIKNPNVIGYILNKASAESTSKLAIDGIFQNLPEFARKAFQPLGCVPFDVNLASPRTLDIAEYLGAQCLMPVRLIHVV